MLTPLAAGHLPVLQRRPPRARRKPAPPRLDFRRVLLPVKSSEHSHAAVNAAARLAVGLGSQVLVLHIRTISVGRAPKAAESEAEASRLVESVVKQLRGASVEAEGQVLTALAGDEAKRIVACADEFRASLVVMGSHGRSDLQGLLRGSISHQVMHLGRCAVLVVRPDARAKPARKSA